MKYEEKDHGEVLEYRPMKYWKTNLLVAVVLVAIILVAYGSRN